MAGSDDLARAVLTACAARGWRVALAESCTGGLVSAALTDIPGSSAVVDRGFVTYSNEAKVDMLGVDMGLIVAHGAVSAEVAQAMVDGALSRSRADIAVAITGIAGPGGGTALKPEGLVHFAAARRGNRATLARLEYGAAGRGQVRAAATDQALSMLLALAAPPPG